MKLLIRHILTLACALHLSGAHWAVLQVTAWTGMLVTRTADSGVLAAVETTFDGQHPCPMCIAISDGQKDERKQDSPRTPDVKKPLELKLVVLESTVVPAPSAGVDCQWARTAESAGRRVDTPPVPPPLA